MFNTKELKSLIDETIQAEQGPIHVHGPGCSHGHQHDALKPIIRESPKVGRNDPCLCGSRKKYKKCCGK